MAIRKINLVTLNLTAEQLQTLMDVTYYSHTTACSLASLKNEEDHTKESQYRKNKEADLDEIWEQLKYE